MRAKLERTRQPEPLPVVEPMGRVIQFPTAKPVIKVASMSCCKAQMMGWDFTRGH
jgi:hypothetical protein